MRCTTVAMLVQKIYSEMGTVSRRFAANEIDGGQVMEATVPILMLLEANDDLVSELAMSIQADENYAAQFDLGGFVIRFQPEMNNLAIGFGENIVLHYEPLFANRTLH